MPYSKTLFRRQDLHIIVTSAIQYTFKSIILINDTNILHMLLLEHIISLFKCFTLTSYMQEFISEAFYLQFALLCFLSTLQII